MEELLDEGVARNVVAVAAVATTARRLFGACSSILVDSAPLVVVVEGVAAVEGTHIDFDELAVSRGLVPPLLLLGRVTGGARVRGLRGGL